MTFDINEFKSVVNAHGGFSRSNLFVVELFSSSPTADTIPDRDIRFFCRTASIPGINVNVAEYYPDSFGIKQSMPLTFNSDPLNCVFMLDDDNRILEFFHRWMQATVNFDVSKSKFSARGGDPSHLPFEIGYKKEYALNMSIKKFSVHDRSKYYECILSDVFPTQISPIDLSWDSNDQIATMTVNFAYSEIKMAGTITSDYYNSDRGFGFLDFFFSIGQRGQAIQQLAQNTGLQGAVNRFTKTVNTFSAIGNLINSLK